jgi:hypothetical protein
MNPFGYPNMMGQPMMTNQMMGQQMMGQQMMGQQMMGGMMNPMMGGMMMPQPIYKQISVGVGIDMVEYQKIVQSATQVYQMKQQPLSQYTANAIKMMLGGEWLCVCYPTTRAYDFTLTTVKGADMMVFSLDNTLFQICRIR